MTEAPRHSDRPAGDEFDFFALAPCAMVICDRQGEIRQFNQAFARLVGWRAGEAPGGSKFASLLSRTSQFLFGAQVLPLLQLAGAVEEIEVDIAGPDGTRHAVLLNGVQLAQPDGTWLHYFSLTTTKARRVYEREQLAARSLLERRQRYLDLAEKLARVGHWHVDLVQRTTFWSPEIYVIHGLEPRAGGPSFDEIIARWHPDDLDEVRRIIGAAIVSHEPFWFQKRLAATTVRTERVVEVSGLVEVGEAGRATGIFGVLRDVTDAVKAQRDLETSEERYRLLANNVPGMIGYWDSAMICRFANQAYLEWFGQSPDALIGRSMPDVLGETLFALNRPYIEGVLAGTDQTFERAIVKPSGEVGHTWANYVPDVGADGRIRGFYALVTDITELKQRNQVEQASHALQAAVLSSTNYMVIATTPQGVVTVFNAAAEVALGYAADAVIGKQTPLLWHDREEIIAQTSEVNKVLPVPIEPGLETFFALPDRKGTVSGEWTFIRQDGSRFPVRLNGSRILDARGQVTGYLGVAEDITERRNAEMALRTSEATFRAAMENASIGMTIIEPPGRWLRVNRALTLLLGYSKEELLQLNFRAITHPEDLEQSDRVVEQLLAGETETSTIEKRYLHKDGRVVWAQLSLSAVRGPDGKAQYLIAQVQDVTERREMERVKNELISTVSHELRTPVTSIRGALGLLAGTMADALPPQANKLIDIANKNSERLNALVNDMLDIEKIASGKMRFIPVRLGLCDLVSAAVEDNMPYAERFGVALVMSGGAPDWQVEVDAGRFAQVMSNLLSNAAKFSPPGDRVEIELSAAGDLFRVAITDHGQGISAEFAPHVFAKFSQADASPTRSRYGSGLGLHITREIVEQMGGAIGFDSPAGQGATFWIELRRA